MIILNPTYRIRAKIARINRQRNLSYRMRLAAIVATDCNTGKLWS
jgi:hypothetical protein